jgi:GNAT superfamily N-acetyltransferase
MRAGYGCMPGNRSKKYLQDLRTFPADARLGYRNDGIGGLWKAVASRSLHRLVWTGRVVVLAQKLDQELDLSLPAGITITSLHQSDWRTLTELVSRRDIEDCRAALANGRHCLVAWRGARPVGYAWVGGGLCPELAMWRIPLPFPRYAAYLWNLYVLPAERRNGIGTALAKARLQKAKELGFQEGWRMVAPSNHASMRTVRNSGAPARVIGELRLVKFLFGTYVRFTPRADAAAEKN